MKKRYYRHPRTTSEKRSSYENKDLIRPARNAKNLPNSWDDIIVDRYKNSFCWKNIRKTKYTDGHSLYKIRVKIKDSKFVIENIIDHLTRMNFVYRLRICYKKNYYEIQYYGKHIGDFDGAEYF